MKGDNYMNEEKVFLEYYIIFFCALLSLGGITLLVKHNIKNILTKKTNVVLGMFFLFVSIVTLSIGDNTIKYISLLTIGASSTLILLQLQKK